MLRKILVLLLFSTSAVLTRSEDAKSDSCEPMEAQLKTDAGNLELHQKLIECYFNAEIHSPSRRAEIEKARAAQELWLVQHAPESKFAGSVAASIDSYSYPGDYTEIKNAWMAQVKTHAENANVLANAAKFLRAREDQAKAEELATKAHRMDPENADVALTLAQLYHLQAISNPALKARLASQSLQLREQVLNSLSRAEKPRQLQEAAKDAFDAGDTAKAKRYAEQLLELAQQGERWSIGDSIHQGNLVLGRLALRGGNVEEAKTRLLAAGNTPGSPVLGSFGPNMTLAKELLEVHQTDTVLQYFDECAQFWKGHEDTLDGWRATVRRGEIPEFGANLIY